MNILVLSPHRDDAAFSLSLSLDHWTAVGHHITVLNCFTRSLYAPYSDAETVPEDRRLDYVSALRRREDEEWISHFKGAHMKDLDILDAPLRLQCDSSIVCDIDVDPNDSAIETVQEAIRSMEAKQFAALVLPLGLGHHVDHRTARDAALPLTPELPCAFYEELPYATRDGVRVDLSRFREDAATRFHEELFPVICHGTHSRPSELKGRLARIYKSQVDDGWIDSITNFSRRYHGGERLWANQAWLKIAVGEKLSTRQRNMEAEPLPA